MADLCTLVNYTATTPTMTLSGLLTHEERNKILQLYHHFQLHYSAYFKT